MLTEKELTTINEKMSDIIGKFFISKRYPHLCYKILKYVYYGRALCETIDLSDNTYCVREYGHQYDDEIEIDKFEYLRKFDEFCENIKRHNK
jgi:hypothetical protein